MLSDHGVPPYKSAVQKRFTADNGKAAETPRLGPDRHVAVPMLLLVAWGEG
jgi:hypothetical protein